MRFAVSTMAALETQEVAPDSKLPKQGGVITVLIAPTQLVLLWVAP
jgi:hypothetical protein